MSKNKIRCYYCQKKDILSSNIEEVKESSNVKYFHKDCLVKYKAENEVKK